MSAFLEVLVILPCGIGTVILRVFAYLFTTGSVLGGIDIPLPALQTLRNSRLTTSGSAGISITTLHKAQGLILEIGTIYEY